MSRPVVQVEPLVEADLPRCADIFSAAFEDDAITCILRPSWLAQPSYSPEKRTRLGAHSLKIAHFDRPDKICMKAVEKLDSGEERILGMAIWSKPGAPIHAPTMEQLAGGKDDEKDEETDLEALHRLTTELAETRSALLGNTPHWYLVFLVIDPAAQGKGVGGALIKWGLEQADTASPPLPVMLESSIPGQAVYPRYGFEKVGSCSLDRKDQEGKVIDKFTFPQMVRRAKQAE